MSPTGKNGRLWLSPTGDDYTKTIADFEQQIMRSMMVPADLVRAELGSGYAAAVEMHGFDRRMEQERAACAVENWLMEEGLDTGALRRSFPEAGVDWASAPDLNGMNCRCTTLPVKVVDKEGNEEVVEARLDLDESIMASMVAAMRDKVDDLMLGEAREEHAAKQVEDWLVPPVEELGYKAVSWSNLKKFDPVADLKNAIKELISFPGKAKQACDQMDALNAAFKKAGST